ncbi:Uncharacterized protein dnm_010100 [Desulfonema magnum]|uniref:Uncharacterized protein n=1 Tax=Desulfonema magnum TaxID=45655 RepID=A0A975BGI4_9BACT|nr:Uncharacterized protein dnm_010100 [Desulfonema magnum]
MNPVQSSDYQDTESHSSLLVQNYLKNNCLMRKENFKRRKKNEPV